MIILVLFINKQLKKIRLGFNSSSCNKKKPTVIIPVAFEFHVRFSFY